MLREEISRRYDYDVRHWSFARRLPITGHAVSGPYNAEPVTHRGDRMVAVVGAALFITVVIIHALEAL